MKYSPILRAFLVFVVSAGVTLAFWGCSSDRMKNQAKEAAARFWQDKAYPGKAFDIQVIEAEKAEGGQFRVKGIVDGETRVGTYSPESETFSEGYYSLAQERNKKIAELEQESKYWKDRADSLEKENYKLKVQLSLTEGQSPLKRNLDEQSVLAPKKADLVPTVAASPQPALPTKSP